jgi:hypothetical protein
MLGTFMNPNVIFNKELITYRDIRVWQPGLRHHRIHDTLHARCEELRHPVPSNFQLSETNIVVSIVISCRTKFDVLWVFGVPEADFCCCVEATDDVVKVVDEF